MTGVLLFSLFGGLISRWRGGGFFPAPKALKNVVWAAPFMLAFVLMGFLIPALIITIGGLLKGAAYAIGWSIYPQGTGKGIPWLNEATAIGEFLAGVAAYAALGIGVQLI